VLLTHTDRDPFNPDHAEAFFAVEKARALAAGAGPPSAFGDPFQPPSSCSSSRTSPSSATHADRLRRHHGGDRAEAAAMAEMGAQSHLHTY
jgi:4-oxalomesaconate hydratase